MNKNEQREYFWGLTIKKGNNLNFLLAENAQDGNYVAAILHKKKKTSTWGEGKTEMDAVANLKVKIESRHGEVENWKARMFDVCAFDEGGNSINAVHGSWSLFAGYNGK